MKPETCFVFSLLLSILSFGVGAHVRGGDDYSRSDFPDDFVFGSGTSAYQVEGAANKDGTTPSICDTFSHAGSVINLILLFVHVHLIIHLTNFRI